jgi:hypothetical protein
MEKTAMPIIAGILAVVSGGCKLLALLGLVIASYSEMFSRVFALQMRPETSLLIIGIPLAILGVLAIAGGVCALQRKHFLWAVIGSIAALLPFSCLGLAAIILAALSESEFE